MKTEMLCGRQRVLSQRLWGGGPGGCAWARGACTFQVDTSGHQALQLHSGGVVLFSIGVVEGDSSPASKGGPGGLRHLQFLKSLGWGKDTQKRNAKPVTFDTRIKNRDADITV